MPFSKAYAFLATAACSLIPSLTFSGPLGMGTCDFVLQQVTWEALFPISSGVVIFVLLPAIVIVWVLHDQARFPISARHAKLLFWLPLITGTSPSSDGA